MAVNKTKIYSVSQVNSLIKVILEQNLPPRMVVTGQISDWKRHISGHCYFLLKDESSVLPCVMWSSNFKKVKFAPENGLAVLAAGFIDVYQPGGKYQFYADKLEPAGLGALQFAFEQMVKRLGAEGLFDERHKKPIPAYPMRIGILTSPSGAAVHDIKESIHSRWPCAKLLLEPIPVQGKQAAGKIAAALRDVNRRNNRLKLDVLIVGRGGGSLEDLWAFNEEVLARAIFESEVPVISAVGHEVDTTIADLVADRRASTPTRAGVAAVPDAKEVAGQLDYFGGRLNSVVQWNCRLCRKNLDAILASTVFRSPLGPVCVAGQMLDEIAGSLTRQLAEKLTQAKTKLHQFYEQIVRLQPHRALGAKSVELNHQQNQLHLAAQAVINKIQTQLAAAENRLAALNPKAVLQRGYSITTDKKSGRVIAKPQDVEVGDLMVTELAGENLIESRVTKKRK